VANENAQARRRLAVIQPLVPHYRIPLFERIARQPGIDLVVLADIQAKTQLNQYHENVGFEARHLPYRSLPPFVFRPGRRSLLRDIRPDAVLFQGDPRDIRLLADMKWCRRREIPFGVWGRFYRLGRRRWISEYLMARMGRLAEVVLCYGRRDQREMLARGTHPEKLVPLYNTIDQSPIIAVRDAVWPQRVEGFRDAEGLRGRRVLIQVARLTDTRRTDVLLRAFARLQRRRTDVELVLIGGGPLENQTKRIARKLGLDRHVRFLGPIYDEQRLALWYSVADVFATATSIGLSIHHAMCHGVPVVTDDNPRTQTAEFEILQDGINGLTYRSGDLEDFCRKLCFLLDRRDVAEAMSIQARRRVEEVHHIEGMVERFVAGVSRLFPHRPTEHGRWTRRIDRPHGTSRPAKAVSDKVEAPSELDHS